MKNDILFTIIYSIDNDFGMSYDKLKQLLLKWRETDINDDEKNEYLTLIYINDFKLSLFGENFIKNNKNSF